MAPHLRRELCDLVVHEAPDRLALLRVVEVRVGELRPFAQREAEAAPHGEAGLVLLPAGQRQQGAQGLAGKHGRAGHSFPRVRVQHSHVKPNVREKADANRAMVSRGAVIKWNVLTASENRCRGDRLRVTRGSRGEWPYRCHIRAQPATSGAKPASSSALHHRIPSTSPSSSGWAEAGWAVPSLPKRWQYTRSTCNSGQQTHRQAQVPV